MNTKNIVIAGLAVIALLFGYLYMSRSASFGSSTGPQHYQRETFLQGLQVSQKGTELSNAVITTCSMIANATVASTTPGYAYCTGVTGITSSDLILAKFSTSTLGFSPTNEGFYILSAKASTTAGAIDFIVGNASGKSQAPSAGGRMGSTTVIFGIH